MNNKTSEDYLWWQKGIIYQIYPRSFYDSNDDGTGDLKGIIEKLDYLQWLGIDSIWVSPFYPSPMDDFGYDISDYKGIEPIFGDMSDFEELVQEIHNREMQIILDLVPNHTSYQHPWFQESRSSRDNPKRDWYIWENPAADGGPPTNWYSVFGGSGWEFDELTEQYYYHAFLKEQPDLNWRNPEVQKAMLNVMDFWLKKGIDGFRVDVIWHMIKDDQLRNNPPDPTYKEGAQDYDRLIKAYSEDQPMVHDIIARMRKKVDEYGDKLLIGEIYLPLDKLVTYYGKDDAGVHLPFNFQLISVEWKAEKIYALINEYEGSLPPDGWPNWVLGNHDKSRIISRVGAEQAKVAAILLLTLRGTPTMYYGDELGMEDVDIPDHRIRDPKNKTMPGYTRDPERTPMQWTEGEYAGFSKTEPWLPLSPEYQTKNVATQQNDENSMLHFYKKLIDLRNNEPALQIGDFIPDAIDNEVMSYRRIFNEQEYLIILNFSNNKATYELGENETGEIKLTIDPVDKATSGKLKIPPHGGMIIKLKK